MLSVWFESSFKSLFVTEFKFAVLKQVNEGRMKVVREGISKKILKTIMKAFYRRSYRKVIHGEKVSSHKDLLSTWYEKVLASSTRLGGVRGDQG